MLPLRLKVLLAGFFSQLLCLGVARFAYTPLLPLMQQQSMLDDASGGYLAAVNYLGYMSGALLAASLNSLALKDRLYRFGLLLAIISTLGMALTENIWLWAFWRYLAGLSSAGSMLIASGLILHWLLQHKLRAELGVHFAGLGLGIALAALAVELMLWLDFDWRQQWYLLALLGVALAVPAWRWLPPPVLTDTSQQQTAMQPEPGSRFIRLMLFSYFGAGYGYVVTATFIVTIVERLPGLTGSGNLAFVLLGLAAAPAVLVWDLLARGLGFLNAIILALLLQTLAIVLPLTVPGLWPVLFSAALFGATFIGVVSLVLTMAGRLYPTKPARLMGKLTLAYGLAQVIAPAITGVLAKATGSYQPGLLLAAGFVALSALLLYWLKRTDQTLAQLQ
ncbi:MULTISPECIES: YbfB/YjiJ family MFS transporter [Alishewanella]|uniref:Major facilitator transporter n=1 Tax=Alishewanella jeotgali KCTC 22429 TaxID=1129374 RepID=H3ZEM4_9ALTE|nr:MULTISPECIES: YbfB/YjiJ family MFS transporter [Alishewanella]EHR40987.1 major facilitator transporter [Alishewanella jeotgali KCTC 22429]MCT8127687.1 YbfB/YjiJ family MFS transporter [Alishewanella sp. BS5-314]OCW97019.1 MFS transporter [Alishewanella sp. HH-ZS]